MWGTVKPLLQSICSHATSNVVWEGKDATGKLRQRTISKETFVTQQKISILTVQVPWKGMRVSQPDGASPLHCKRHRVTANDDLGNVSGSDLNLFS